MAFRIGAKEWIGGKPRAVYFQSQLPIDYLDTTITQNVWETVSADLSGGRVTRLWYVIIEQTNNGATAEDIELEITLTPPSGTPTAYTWAFNATSGTPYYCLITPNLTAGDFSTNQSNVPWVIRTQDGDHSVQFTCSAVGLIRVRQTSAVDVTSAQIEVNIVWDKLVPVGV